MSEAPGADTLELERLPADLVDLAGHVMSLAIGYGVTARPDVLASYIAAKAEFLRRLAAERAEKEELRRERDEARRKAEHWLECFEVLNKAVVGETGRSAIMVAPELRSRAKAAESLLAEAGKALELLSERLQQAHGVHSDGSCGICADHVAARSVATRIASLTKEPDNAE